MQDVLYNGFVHWEIDFLQIFVNNLNNNKI